ncbi:hypothetical protein FB451DRAFT_1348479 [Mycena latifolia]|nr:hypothetical protein FB451DRAFT_1348479 [Mycena latifolia]
MLLQVATDDRMRFIYKSSGYLGTYIPGVPLLIVVPPSSEPPPSCPFRFVPPSVRAFSDFLCCHAPLPSWPFRNQQRLSLQEKV